MGTRQVCIRGDGLSGQNRVALDAVEIHADKERQRKQTIRSSRIALVPTADRKGRNVRQLDGPERDRRNDAEACGDDSEPVDGTAARFAPRQ